MTAPNLYCDCRVVIVEYDCPHSVIVEYDCPHSVFLEYDCPHSVLVLAEEEIVAIDLETEGWPSYKLPYLCSLHSSAITCAQHVGNIPEQLVTKISDAGEQQMPNFSTRVSKTSEF